MKTPLALFCFIDAFGWDILQRVRFLEEEAPFRKALGTTFGYSSAAVPSILTGRLPEENGHWSCFYYSPETSPFREIPWLRPLGWLPRALTERSRFRYYVSRGLQQRLGYTGYFQIYNVPFHLLPLFDYSEKKDLFVPGGVNRGRSIFDDLAEARVQAHVSNWRRGEAENMAAALEAVADPETRFVFLYMGGFDSLLHLKGTRHPEVERRVAWYDERLRDVLEAARRVHEVELYVFSDHGQADVHEVHDLMGPVERLPLRYGHDYVAMYDSTMFRCWILRASAEQPLRELLGSLSYGRILSAAEMAAMGVGLAPEMTGDIVFLLDEGVLIAPSFMGRKPVAGMHGYHPAAPSSFGMVASSRAVDEAVTIRDMHGVMRGELQRVGSG